MKCVVDEVKSKEVESAELVWPVLGTEALIRIGSNMLPSLLAGLEENCTMYYIIQRFALCCGIFNL
jgi:hypothetical protein